MQKNTNGILTAVLAGLAVAVAVQSMVMVKLYRSLEMAETRPEAEAARMDVQLETEAEQAPVPNTRRGSPTTSTIPQFGGFGYRSGTWDPFQEFQNMRQQMDQMFNDSFGRLRQNPDLKPLWDGARFSPSMDLEENHDNYVVRMDIPGAEKSDITIHIEDRNLVVAGSVDETLETQGQNQLRKERRTGEFKRSLTLPGPVMADKMKANYEQGVLTITIPKAVGQGTYRRIEVM